MTEKATGYTLLFSGLALIIIVSLNVYQVFTKQTPPIQYFNLPPFSINTSAFLPADLKTESPAPTLELMSGKTISDSANLTIHLILMSFLVGVGTKVASLGIQLLRPIEVKLNSK
jgi:hypothetical protein